MASRPGGLGGGPKGQSSLHAAKMIKPVRRNPQDQFPEAWNKLSTSIKEIYKKNASSLSFEELYRNAYNMVIGKHGDKLYDGVEREIKEHLQQIAIEVIVPAFPMSSAVSGSSALSNLTSHNASSSSHGASSADPALAGGGTGISSTEGQAYLKVLKDVWEEHITCMTMIRDILLYMDRVYVKAAQRLPTYDLGLELYRDTILHSKTYPIRERTTDTLLNLIHLERKGERIDRLAIKGVVDMLLTLDQTTPNSRTSKTVYDTDFEPHFLEASKNFYTAESAQVIATSDAKEFMVRIDRRLSEEEQRSRNFLGPTTEARLRPILEKVLISDHVKSVVYMPNSGLVSLINDGRIDDLKRMYRLLGRVEAGHREMRAAISGHIKELGKAVCEAHGGVTSSSSVPSNANDPVPNSAAQAASKTQSSRPGTSKKRKGSMDVDNEETDSTVRGKTPNSVVQSASAAAATSNATADAADTSKTPSTSNNGASAAAGGVMNPHRWTEALLEIKDKYDKVLESAFRKDKAFLNEINEALSHVINEFPRGAEFISIFIDENLKKGIKGKSEAEVDSLLDKAIVMFRLIKEKDVFERYYKNHLASRLLSGKSVSDDAEKSLIAKIRIECGNQFTSNLENMFKDMSLSVDIMNEYRNRTAASAQSNAPELTVYVLTKPHWPLQVPATTLIYPPELTAVIEHFQQFYLTRHVGRRLTWLQRGHADIRANFPKGKKELNVQINAMVVLVGVFNNLADGEKVTFTEIQEATGIPPADLRRTLQSLSLAKYKILTKGSKGKDVAETDTFTLNLDFSAPLTRIKVLPISSKSGGGGGAEVENDAEARETKEKVEKDRKHLIEAAVVRIMKARKRLDHSTLLNEVITQLGSRFSPKPEMFKKMVESLIEREYLERDTNDMRYYKYLA